MTNLDDLAPLAVKLIFLIVTLNITYGVYQAFFSPLARIPGPRLAAATGWYEAYYDFFLEGKWPQQILKLHERYGPIVRINPREVHVQDKDFTNQLYNSRFSKDKKWLYSLAQDILSVPSTPDHATHQARRAPMNPFFSRAGISSRISTVDSIVEKMCDRLSGIADGKTIIRIEDVYVAATLDIIALFCYGEQYNYLDRPDFGAEWRVMMRSIFESPALLRAFPIFYPVMALLESLPRFVASSMHPILKTIIFLKDNCRSNIMEVQKNWDAKAKSTKQPDNVFTVLLNSDLPPSEKTVDRLVPEGLVLIVAGSDTTAKSLLMATYHILRNPEILGRVRKEIDTLAASGNSLNWNQLEKLPWLTAAIKEGIRMAGSITARSPRIIDQDIVYQGHVIPAGTVVSQTMYLLLHDPKAYPEPQEFRPQRWLDEASNGSVTVKKDSLVAWSRGPRNCLGMWLSLAEMYTVIAQMVHQFDMELYETDDTDVVMDRDRFLPYPKDGSQGVRMRLSPRTVKS